MFLPSKKSLLAPTTVRVVEKAEGTFTDSKFGGFGLENLLGWRSCRHTEEIHSS